MSVMKGNKMKEKIHFATIGCGRLGTNLSIRLKEAGHIPVGLSARHLESMKPFNDIIKAPKIDTVPWKITSGANVVFITTPDDCISEVCNQLVEKKCFHANTILYHCSGSLSSEALSAARTSGLNIGSLHPLQSFPVRIIKPNPFEGIFVSIEGSPLAIEVGKQIVMDLKAKVVEISTEGKKLYHAAAVAASNYLVTLLNMAKQFNIASGMSEEVSLAVLKPLIQGTLNNIEKQGITDALTGPISRGDIQTIKNHIEQINTKKPEFSKLYKILGQHTTLIAKKSLSENMALLLNEILET